MAHSAEEVQNSIKKYLAVGFVLLLLTAVTVMISYLDLAVVPSIILALIVATVKGSLVAAVFMHLIDEKQLIYWALLLTVFFFVVLMFLPVSQYLNLFDGVTH